MTRCPPSTRPWSGRYAQRMSRLCLSEKGTVCHLQLPGVCIQVATEADHLVPRSRGGCDCLHNLEPACGPCNRERGADPLALPAEDGLAFFKSGP